MPYFKHIENYKPINDQEASDQKIMLDYMTQFSDTILTRANEIAHMTSSGLILNKTLDKVLMIHHNIYGTWTWTGGHADGESDLLKVALKEAREETGVKRLEALDEKIASIDILPVWGHHKRGTYVSAHLHLNTSYVLIADETDELVINHEETSGVKWVEIDRLHEFSNEPYLIVVYKKMIDRARRLKGLE